MREIDRLVRSWELVLDGELVRTPSGWIATGASSGTPVVLKVATSPDDARSCAALEHFQGAGAVRVFRRDGDSGAYLAERADPGITLSRLVFDGCDDRATETLCEIAGILHRHSSPLSAFPTVSDWGKAFPRYAEPGGRTISQSLLSTARDAYAGLVSSQDVLHLLHGDLHHDNIVLDETHGWLAIDPKGVIGEPAYEFGAMLRNPGDDTAMFARSEIIARRVKIIVARTGLEPHRIIGWSFAQSVLSAIWSLEDGDSPARGLAYADAVIDML